MSPTRAATSGTPASLSEDLAYVAQRRLPAMFRDRATDEEKYSTLARVVRTIEPELWDDDPTRALRKTMRRAVKELSDSDAPERFAQECTWRHIGLTLYFGSELDASLHEYGDYLIRLAEDSGYYRKENRDFRRFTQRFRRKLADILLDMEQKATESRTLGTHSSTSSTAEDRNVNSTHTDSISHIPLYVHRSDLRQRFEQLVVGGAKLIVFHGQPGMGKTWAAKAITTSSDGTAAPCIRINGTEILFEDLCVVLQAQGVPARPEKVLSNEKAYLAQLLTGEHAPEVILLDNLDNADTLRQLVPEHTRSVVVATCRSTGQAPPSHCQFIPVDKMTTVEAEQMARLRVGDMSQEDAHLLAATLHGHPLIIGHACTLIDRQKLSVSTFCRDLVRDSNRIIGRVHTEDGEKLVRILRQLAQLIANEDHLAGQLVECIGYLGRWEGLVHQQFLWNYLSTDLDNYLTPDEYSENQPRIPETSFLEALDVLKSFSLIDTTLAHNFSGELVLGDIIVHPMTRDALRLIFADSIYVIGMKTAQVTIREDGQDYRQRIRTPKKADITLRIAHDILHENRLKHEIEVFSEFIPSVLKDPELTVEPLTVLIGMLWFKIMAETKWHFREDLPPGTEYASGPMEALRECLNLIYSDKQADDFLSIIEKENWSPRTYWHTNFSALYDRVARLWRSKNPTGPIIKFGARLSDD